MMDGQMMNGMDGGMMMFCMIATALFVLIILVAIIVQTVLQAKILRELRRLHEGRSAVAGPQGSPEAATE